MKQQVYNRAIALVLRLIVVWSHDYRAELTSSSGVCSDGSIQTGAITLKCDVPRRFHVSDAQNTCSGLRAANQRCYSVSSEARNWRAAEASCRSRGQHLASIRDYVTQDAVMRLMTQEFSQQGDVSETIWLGGQHTDNFWRWIRGEAVAFCF